MFNCGLVSSQQAFSVFFVCVAFTSDIICLLFIPVQWLFFAASTYVWVQYVWHTGEDSQRPFGFIFYHENRFIFLILIKKVALAYLHSVILHIFLFVGLEYGGVISLRFSMLHVSEPRCSG